MPANTTFVSLTPGGPADSVTAAGPVLLLLALSLAIAGWFVTKRH